MNTPPLPLWKRILRFTAFGVATILTLLALGLSWFSFQGRREWARTKADLQARGEILSLVGLAPPAIPDNLNVFAAPPWRELAANPDGSEKRLDSMKLPVPSAEFTALQRAFPTLDKVGADTGRVKVALRLWSAEKSDPAERARAATFVLALLKPLEPLGAEIIASFNRPGARFPIAYEKGFFASLPHISPVLLAGQFFSVRAKARLAIGDRPGALADVLATLRLSETLASEPFLISALVRIAILSLADSSIRSGIEWHEWTAEDLRTLSAALKKINLVPGLALALRGERGGFNGIFDRPRAATGILDILGAISGSKDGQSSWKTRVAELELRGYLGVFGSTDRSFYNRTLQSLIEALGKAPDRPLIPKELSLPDIPSLGALWRATHFLSALTFPSFSTPFPLALYRQDTLTATGIACALEQYRLVHHAYPDLLENLRPEFLPKIPVDIFGREFHYRRMTPDSFRLWSAGWNGTNEGGQVASRRSDFSTQDWVWNEEPGNPPASVK